MSKEYFEVKSTKELCRLLGLPASEANKVEARRNLVLAIEKVIKQKKWTHEVAAKKAHVGRTVITAILNGNIKNISTDRLIDIAQNLGLSVQIKVA
ncbi:MAG: XRE family transcriptional regulator [Pseudobdellovibrionaceae bacterium]|nr:XRE family transcriptional regulator [Bdellovibrionales bacterium]USN47873.1 MAG: XRE family transcriptional regulator [Pseudobdellovibrionaceae bacterium]